MLFLTGAKMTAVYLPVQIFRINTVLINCDFERKQWLFIELTSTDLLGIETVIAEWLLVHKYE